MHEPQRDNMQNGKIWIVSTYSFLAFCLLKGMVIMLNTFSSFIMGTSTPPFLWGVALFLLKTLK